MWQFFIAIIQALTGQCILRCSPKVTECANRRFALVASTGFGESKPKNYTPHSSLIGGNIILGISPDPFNINTRQERIYMEKRNRKNEFKLRLSDDEMALFEEKFKLSGLSSRSKFLRHLIIYGFTYDIDYSELKDYTRELSAIGRNINQIAHKVNTDDKVPSEDIEYIKKELHKIWRIQESILSNQPLVHQYNT